MPMTAPTPDRYFQLHDHIGVDDAGNPEPLHAVGVVISTPTMRDGEVIDAPGRVTVQPIPGTRMVQTDDPRIAGALLATGQFEEVDPPEGTALPTVAGSVDEPPTVPAGLPEGWESFDRLSLNELATELGVESAAELPNKPTVIDAIHAAVAGADDTADNASDDNAAGDEGEEAQHA